jgi:hypothetical protein
MRANHGIGHALQQDFHLYGNGVYQDLQADRTRPRIHSIWNTIRAIHFW